MESVEILGADDEKLKDISRKGQLSLNLEEMRAIKDYYSRIARNPSDVELETLAQTWSEHCVHKTFRGDIVIDGRRVENLLKSRIAKVTKELALPWCFSVFEDNAGIVDFEDDVAVAFKVETHNHPSALEPFGGAATGVGGVIRDILGVWGEPIANTNVLCFGPLDYPYEKLPPGTKHPRFIYRYVVKGIGSYGNNMGIPTVNGAIFFDKGYIGNPLVFCGTVGLVQKSKFKKEAKKGDIALLVGGKTGRDGIHGVTFASAELHEASQDVSVTAVQIGDPIQEEKIKRAVLKVMELELGSAITDLGGGGLSSAIGEMAKRHGLGAKIHLDRVPLKYPGMAPWEIWVSESQERMLLCIPKKNLQKVLDIFKDEDVEATPIGEFTDNRKLQVYFRDELVLDLGIEFMFSVPKVEREARWTQKKYPEPNIKEKNDLTSDLLAILASPNCASKEAIIRTYDHEVKAMSVLKPLQGAFNDGPGDAAVMKPLNGSWKGIVISNGLNPEYGKIDPYWMAATAIDEAIRNNIAVGGRRIAILDNFCWGNPEKPEILGGLLRATDACYDIAKAFGTPFISGKDSLYNESTLGPVTPTLLISALGIIPDVRKAVSMDMKKAGDSIYIINETREELGGSHYYKIHNAVGNEVPKVRPEVARQSFEALAKAIDLGLVEACHDLSEGGLGIAIAEMAFAGDIGAEIDLKKVPADKKIREDKVIFSETSSRFLVEVKPENSVQFEECMKGNVFAEIGRTTKDKTLVINDSKDTLVLTDLNALKENWRRTLEDGYES